MTNCKRIFFIGIPLQTAEQYSIAKALANKIASRNSVEAFMHKSISGQPALTRITAGDSEIDEASRMSALDDAGHRVPLLVLSRDASLVETARKAAPRNMLVLHSPDVDQLAETLANLKPGVLLTDAGETRDIASMLAQLTQHFPELVCVVAGKVAERATLMQLTAAGRIFRFLLTPLSHGQTRLALEAANARHLELKASADRLDSGTENAANARNYLAAYTKLAAGLIVTVGAIWWAVSMFTLEQQSPPQVSTREPTTLPTERPDPVQAELRLAKEAFDQGRYLEPPGESALDLYRSAVALDPGNDAARAGIRAVADKILERAEAALTKGELEGAVRNIESAREIDATHPRLAFLDVQISREHERLKLSRAHDITERVSTLVAQAYERMRQGNLFTPAGGSARDALFAARRLDPTDPTVTQAMRDLSVNLVEAARRFATVGKTKEAQLSIDAARGIGTTGASLAAVERALNSAVRADSASPTSSTTAKLSAATRTLDESKSHGAADTSDPRQRPSDVLDSARTNSRSAENAAAKAAPDLAAGQAGGVLQAADLHPTRQVTAKYPTRAAISGTEGWVDIEFTISPDGIPQDLQVRDARPKRMFDRAALDALEQWRFEPVNSPNGPIAQRAMLRMRFQLE
jgi:protein TonB